MANYRSSVNNRVVASATSLGYPWILLDDEGDTAAETKEIMAKTADFILLEVGDDPDLAQAALDAEQARETPRKVLSTRLRQIIAAGAS
jgi:hypothetical protein